MNSKEHAERLRRGLSEMDNDRTFFELNNKMKALKFDRIFKRGEDINGNVLTYSSKEIWVSVADSPRRIPPKGKSRKAEKTAYFENGYAQFKAAAGRADRPLFLFGSLQAAYLNNFNIGIDTGKIVLGTIIKSSTNNPEGKLEGLGNRYADWFNTAQTEKDAVIDLFKKILLRTFGFS
jgi:hypothetical protein